MSELISGKEALIALANGENLEQNINGEWHDIRRDISWRSILGDGYRLRLKPKTITINGIEVPAPFEPKEGERYWFMSTSTILGYAFNDFELDKIDSRFMVNGAWKSEDEIKQVVAALRKIFVINNQ